MSAESELEQRIAGLDPSQFERLVYDLVQDEHPEAVKLDPPEQGADMLVLATEGERARVWQAKRYTGTPHWGQCETSLTDPIEAYQPQSVTFVFARDLTGPQLKTFESRLREKGAAVGVAVDHWGLSALRGRLQRNPHVRIRYFGRDEQTMLDILANRSGAAGPAQQAFGLEESFGADDPAFEFEVELFRRGVPQPAMVEGASLTVLMREGPKTLRVAATARDADAGPGLAGGSRFCPACISPTQLVGTRRRCGSGVP